MPNQGEQCLPIVFENGASASCVFQVADVSRPLVGVGRICELGNRVTFGANGGIIHNLATGKETVFHRKEGVYMFQLWIPPPDKCPGFNGQP